MSMIRCVVCEKDIDSDYTEIAETDEGLICRPCEIKHLDMKEDLQ